MQAETQSTEHNAQPPTTGTRTDIHNESLCVTHILNCCSYCGDTIYSLSFTSLTIWKKSTTLIIVTKLFCIMMAAVLSIHNLCYIAATHALSFCNLSDTIKSVV